MMIARMYELERMARVAMGDSREPEPLPPGPNYSPFGYFRLGVLLLAVIIALVILGNFFWTD